MTTELPNVPPQFQASSPTEELPVTAVNIAPIGELIVGGGSADVKFVLTALSVLDNPDLNYFFMVNKLKLKDRLTGTQIFPRDGMALPNGEVYKTPEPTNEEQSNAS